MSVIRAEFVFVDLLLSVKTVLLSLSETLVEEVIDSEVVVLLVDSVFPLFTVVLSVEDAVVGDVLLLTADTDLLTSSVPVVLLP